MLTITSRLEEILEMVAEPHIISTAWAWPGLSEWQAVRVVEAEERFLSSPEWQPVEEAWNAFSLLFSEAEEESFFNCYLKWMDAECSTFYRAGSEVAKRSRETGIADGNEAAIIAGVATRTWGVSAVLYEHEWESLGDKLTANKSQKAAFNVLDDAIVTNLNGLREMSFHEGRLDEEALVAKGNEPLRG